MKTCVMHAELESYLNKVLLFVIFCVCEFMGDQTSEDAHKEVRDVALWVARADVCSLMIFD